jgi:pimeloyl-ACP methyl ester carboxylesterase
MRATLALAALLPACASQPAPQHPRPALLLPQAMAAPYELPGPVALDQFSPGEGGRMRTFRGTLAAAAERAEFELVLPAGRAPFVLLLPILAGGDSLMRGLAEGLCERGFAVGWNHRVASALRPPQRGDDLERLFRRTVIQNRMLLAWARTTDLVRGDEASLFGVSMGGMVGALILAVEPDLRAGALCLAGADLPDLVVHSGEGRVRNWLAWREAEDQASTWAVSEELRGALTSDPARFAAFVPTDKVLLVHARLDDVVPVHYQDLLWEALGRPSRMLVPTGHYTAALAIGPILDAAAAFFTGRLPQGAVVAEAY